MSPLEGRGVVATFDHRLDQLTLYTGAQMPTHRSQWPVRLSGHGAGAESESCRPISAGGSVTREFCCRKKSALPGLRCIKLRRPLDRRSARASDRERQLPRAPLQDHRVCGSRRPPARDRLRGNRRFRCLFVVSLLGLSRGRAGGEHPAGSLPDAGLSLPNLLGRDQ